VDIGNKKKNVEKLRGIFPHSIFGIRLKVIEVFF
jgi:hypothetical protein